MLTILLSLIWWTQGFNAGIQSILFISVLHLMIYAGRYRDTHAPVVDVIFIFTSLFSHTKTSLEKVKETNTLVDYTTQGNSEGK